MKIYENYFAQFNYNGASQSGLKYAAQLLYEDRMPLNNTTDFSIIKYDPQKFTPNYPYEKIDSSIYKAPGMLLQSFL